MVHCVATFYHAALECVPQQSKALSLPRHSKECLQLGLNNLNLIGDNLDESEKKTNSPTHPEKNQSLTITTKGPHFCRHKSCRDIWVVEEAKKKEKSPSWLKNTKKIKTHCAEHGLALKSADMMVLVGWELGENPNSTQAHQHIIRIKTNTNTRAHEQFSRYRRSAEFHHFVMCKHL